MATVKRFEELIIWKVAREQCKEVQTLIDETALGKDYSLKDQISRSSGSVMDNIAEGFDRFTRAEFKHFLIIARGSNAEVRSQLYRIQDKAYISPEQTIILIKTNRHLSIQITNLINHLGRTTFSSKPTRNDNTLREPEQPYEVISYDLPDEIIE